jgi:hypothetical protein
MLYREQNLERACTGAYLMPPILNNVHQNWMHTMISANTYDIDMCCVFIPSFNSLLSALSLFLFPSYAALNICIPIRRSKTLDGISRWCINKVVATDAIKPAIVEGMDKSTLVHTQIQIIIIHFLPSSFLPIPNG